VRRTLDPVAVTAGLQHVNWVQQLLPAGRRVRLPLANWGRSVVVLASGSSEDELGIHKSLITALLRAEHQLFGEVSQVKGGAN